MDRTRAAMLALQQGYIIINNEEKKVLNLNYDNGKYILVYEGGSIDANDESWSNIIVEVRDIADKVALTVLSNLGFDRITIKDGIAQTWSSTTEQIMYTADDNIRETARFAEDGIYEIIINEPQVDVQLKKITG